MSKLLSALLILIMALPAGGVSAADVAMINDIPVGHIRLPYFDVLARRLTRETDDALNVKVNPGNKVLLGKAGLEAIRNGSVQMGWVNTAHLEAISPRVGFINLPFTIDDEVMGKDRVRNGVVDLINASLDITDVRVLGLMRAADQVFIFRDRQLARPDDLKGVKVRVAGTGIYEDIMTGLGAVPVAIPPREIKRAVEAGLIDGVFTSPGGWSSTVGMSAPKANLVPGLMFITYSLVVNRAWYDALPTDYRQVIADAARGEVTDKWRTMLDDDLAQIDSMVKQGATFHAVPTGDLGPWKARVASVSASFNAKYPDVAAKFAELLH